MGNGYITDVAGIRVGHFTDLRAATGCSVVLCDLPMTSGCFVAGAAPGTRETALLDPTCTVEEVHAVLLGGGSAYGLDAAGGVMRYLEEQGRGFDVGVARVPIVPAAILFDLGIGDPRVRPGPGEGYQACLAARGGAIDLGNVGAGTGATVGKSLGPANAMKGGLGSASVRLPSGVTAGALVAVNCVGDVVDPASGRIVAGARDPGGKGFAGAPASLPGGSPGGTAGTNTTVAVIATDARLDKAQSNRLARLAYQGLTWAVRPVTAFDGDTIFALAAREGVPENLSILGAAAAQALAAAILAGVAAAETLLGYPCAAEVAGSA